MTLENDILSAKDPIDKARDVIAENSAELTPKKARKLFEAAFTKILDELEDYDREFLFEMALEESGATDDRILWGSAFNSYAALLALVKAIRKPGEFKEGTPSSYADEVMSAGNPLGAVFALFRKHKDMSRNDAKGILELAFSSSLVGLSNEAREAVFDYAADRGVSWLEVGQAYDNVIDVVRRIKRPLYADL